MFRRIRDLFSFEQGLQILVALNVLDAVSTQVLLAYQLGFEANPLMAWAYGLGVDGFWAIKILLVLVALVFIGKIADPAVARSIVASANLLYFLVLLSHILNWVTVLG